MHNTRKHSQNMRSGCRQQTLRGNPWLTGKTQVQPNVTQEWCDIVEHEVNGIINDVDVPRFQGRSFLILFWHTVRQQCVWSYSTQLGRHKPRWTCLEEIDQTQACKPSLPRVNTCKSCEGGLPVGICTGMSSLPFKMVWICYHFIPISNLWGWEGSCSFKDIYKCRDWSTG